jgi:hypothetical protein
MNVKNIIEEVYIYAVLVKWDGILVGNVKLEAVVQAWVDRILNLNRLKIQTRAPGGRETTPPCHH